MKVPVQVRSSPYGSLGIATFVTLYGRYSTTFDCCCCFSVFFAPAHRTWDKGSPYECGFHPFEDARKEFNIHFYLIALLFVAFDLEVLLLLPWVTNLSELDTWAYWFGCLFLLFLLIGFIYEWQTGALTW